MSEHIGNPEPEVTRREPTEEERMMWKEEMHMDMPEGTYWDTEKKQWIVPDLGNLPVQLC